MNRPTVSVIRLTGELEIGRKAEMRDSLRLAGDEQSVLVDFSEVTYADSATLAELVRFHNEAEKAGVPVAIVVGDQRFTRLLQYAGLAEAFAVFDDRSSALTFLSEKTR